MPVASTSSITGNSTPSPIPAPAYHSPYSPLRTLPFTVRQAGLVSRTATPEPNNLPSNPSEHSPPSTPESVFPKHEKYLDDHVIGFDNERPLLGWEHQKPDIRSLTSTIPAPDDLVEAHLLLETARSDHQIRLIEKTLADQLVHCDALRLQYSRLQVEEAELNLSAAELHIGRVHMVVRWSGYTPDAVDLYNTFPHLYHNLQVGCTLLTIFL
ncbi:hypothetical protein PAXINDRAFT_11003 [Paxillus involutus ATCC 200175]|nr:hypothetical protein PAXINDRAFT_11003 [Paxillus involutus ATCC 200175]